MSILKRRAELIVPVVTRTPAANSWLWDRCSVVPAIFGPQARLPTRAPRERPGPTTPNSSEYGRNEYGGLPVTLGDAIALLPPHRHEVLLLSSGKVFLFGTGKTLA